MQRTDIHRPAAIDPADYEFVAFEYLRIKNLGDASFMLGERDRIRAHMLRTGATYSRHAHGGNCHICGAAAIYTALFYHAPSKVYIRTGLDCAEKLDLSESPDVFRAKVRDALEATKGVRKAEALLELHGLSAAWALYKGGDTGNADDNTIRDLVGKLVKYGNLSEKQIAWMGRLVDAIPHRAAIAAQRAAEHEAAAPVPVSETRIKIEGDVVSIRMADGKYVFSSRMLIKHATGWKAWGSIPKGFEPKVGDRVEFMAAIKASEKDPKFGFFSRPTKARVI